MFDVMKNSRLYKFLRKIAGDEVSITPSNVLEDCLDDIAETISKGGVGGTVYIAQGDASYDILKEYYDDGVYPIVIGSNFTGYYTLQNVSTTQIVMECIKDDGVHRLFYSKSGGSPSHAVLVRNIEVTVKYFMAFIDSLQPNTPTAITTDNFTSAEVVNLKNIRNAVLSGALSGTTVNIRSTDNNDVVHASYRLLSAWTIPAVEDPPEPETDYLAFITSRGILLLIYVGRPSVAMLQAMLLPLS